MPCCYGFANMSRLVFREALCPQLQKLKRRRNAECKSYPVAALYCALCAEYELYPFSMQHGFRIFGLII
jgi:hypothetical protein